MTAVLVGPPKSGELSVLTYNIAGIIAFASPSSPHTATPVIGRKINPYDLVLVQENFCYHMALDANARHPHRTHHEHSPGCTILIGPDQNMGDGLTRFSKSPITRFERKDWGVCHGTFECYNDCIGSKGYSTATHTLARGAEVDVYNLHMDAGSCDGDFTARAAQLKQLSAELRGRSRRRAVILAGDFNLTADPRDQQAYRSFLGQNKLTDLCAAVACRVGGLDRILYRSSRNLRLRGRSWNQPAGFESTEGKPLSDHKPVLGRFSWSLRRPRH